MHRTRNGLLIKFVTVAQASFLALGLAAAGAIVSPLALDAVLDDPGMRLDFLQRDSLIGIRHQ